MTHDDFLRAIIENPDDDAPRLVFADWLEERGESERAEFIRVQIDLARLPRFDERRIGLAKRERELLEKNGEEWVRLFGDRVSFGAFRRGFVAEVTVTTDAFVKHTFEMVHLAPIRRISVDQMGSVEVSHSARKVIAAHIARENLVLPLGWADFHSRCLLIATPSPTDHDLLQRLGFVLSRNVAAVAADAGGLENAISRRYASFEA